MKRETLHLQGDMTVETGKDFNGRFFIAYARGASVFVREHKEVRQFLKLAPKTRSRDALDSWFLSLSLGDQGHSPVPTGPDLGLSERAKAEGFGPECHLDESDPNHQTRTVV